MDNFIDYQPNQRGPTRELIETLFTLYECDGYIGETAKRLSMSVPGTYHRIMRLSDIVGEIVARPGKPGTRNPYTFSKTGLRLIERYRNSREIK